MKSGKENIAAILSLLKQNYTNKGSLININSAFQLLVAAVLSAQSTDKQVNKVTPILFQKFPTPEKLAQAKINEIEGIISSVGLYKNKARNLKKLSELLVNNYGGKVPDNLTELQRLPGVGRKTANVVLNDWFHKHEGIAVDTHVKRIAFRIGLTKNTNPKKIEEDLKKIIPREEWGAITHYLIAHGRKICKAQKPDCTNCFLEKYCEKNGLEVKEKTI